MALYLGAKYNPMSGYENDVCIYLKPRSLKNINDNAYVDVSDSGDYLIRELKNRPKLKAITSSLVSYELLKKILKNKVFFIPEHHCNFERAKRVRNGITAAGIITTPSPANFLLAREMRNKLKKIGVKFITCFYFKNRQDVVDFYKKIDLQLIGCFGYFNDYNPFRHPTKMINAASYGIPTIANWMLGYKEFEDNYVPVRNMDSLISEVEKMKNKDYYDKFASKIISASEPYHISNIAEKYKQLK